MTGIILGLRGRIDVFSILSYTYDKSFWESYTMSAIAVADDVRINARLTGADAVRFQELLDSSGVSASELLRVALREYHRTRTCAKRSPLELLAGYIGAGDGPQDLSANYKSYLAQALENKMPLAVHEPDPPPIYGTGR
jgi:hypothetical protein